MTFAVLEEEDVLYLQSLPGGVEGEKARLEVLNTIISNFQRRTFCQRRNVGETFQLQMLECVVLYPGTRGNIQHESLCHHVLHLVIEEGEVLDCQLQNIVILKRQPTVGELQAVQLDVSDEFPSHLAKISLGDFYILLSSTALEF